MTEATEGGRGVQGRAQELAELIATVSVEFGALLAVTLNELRTDLNELGADLETLTADVRQLQGERQTEKEG